MRTSIKIEAIEKNSLRTISKLNTIVDIEEGMTCEDLKNNLSKIFPIYSITEIVEHRIEKNKTVLDDNYVFSNELKLESYLLIDFKETKKTPKEIK